MPKREPEYSERAAELAEARWHRIETEAERERADHQRRLELVRRLKAEYRERVPFAALDQVLPPINQSHLGQAGKNRKHMKGTT